MLSIQVGWEKIPIAIGLYIQNNLLAGSGIATALCSTHFF